jgi:hypothetical protein
MRAADLLLSGLSQAQSFGEAFVAVLALVFVDGHDAPPVRKSFQEELDAMVARGGYTGFRVLCSEPLSCNGLFHPFRLHPFRRAPQELLAK